MAYKNPEDARAYKKRWQAAHPERALIYQRRYRASHPDTRRAWRAAHREEQRAKSHAYYIATREHHAVLTKGWRERNPERARELTRQWALANPDARVAAKHRRRAREVWTEGGYTAAEWREKLTMFAGLCAYCGAAGRMERDHKIPLARDGSNDIANIVPACGSCNRRKGQKTAAEFLRYRQETAQAVRFAPNDVGCLNTL